MPLRPQVQPVGTQRLRGQDSPFPVSDLSPPDGMNRVATAYKLTSAAFGRHSESHQRLDYSGRCIFEPTILPRRVTRRFRLTRLYSATPGCHGADYGAGRLSALAHHLDHGRMVTYPEAVAFTPDGRAIPECLCRPPDPLNSRSRSPSGRSGQLADQPLRASTPAIPWSERAAFRRALANNCTPPKKFPSG